MLSRYFAVFIEKEMKDKYVLSKELARQIDDLLAAGIRKLVCESEKINKIRKRKTFNAKSLEAASIILIGQTDHMQSFTNKWLHPIENKSGYRNRYELVFPPSRIRKLMNIKHRVSLKALIMMTVTVQYMFEELILDMGKPYDELIFRDLNNGYYDKTPPDGVRRKRGFHIRDERGEKSYLHVDFLVHVRTEWTRKLM